jgi:quercetin dioxygenase-like cupin family protein
MIFPRGEKQTENFSGNVFMNILSSDSDGALYNTVIDVYFEAGAHTSWHSHSNGQALLVTGGVGFYQEKGKKPRRLTGGDIVKVVPNVIHSHGAVPNSDFTHIAVNPAAYNNAVVWAEPLTEEEYNSAVRDL